MVHRIPLRWADGKVTHLPDAMFRRIFRVGFVYERI
jgi:hypothetical protein